jgi:hypothetical protein
MSRNRAILTAPSTRPAIALLLICMTLAAPSWASTTASTTAITMATIAPSLLPDKLGGKAALSFNISYSGGEFGVPSPLRRSVLRLPAGLSLDIPKLRICGAARLRARGAGGCPSESEIGSGHALVEAHAGSQTVTEHVGLRVFLGPLQGLQPTLMILGQGYTPLDERVVLSGRVLPDRAPFGEALTISIPPIPALPFQSDASIVAFSLTIGTGGRSRTHGNSAVLVPSSCPPGGFPFAAEFTYADGSSSSAYATTLCPH